jgi:uncharacterized protein YfiM (DUF2279 family)
MCYFNNMKTFLISLIICFASINISSAQLISSDDKLHLAAGALISAGTYTYIYSTTKNKKKAFWFSLAMSATAGLLKEVYDSTKDGNRFDTGEAVATTIGGLVASLSFEVFTRKNRNKN